MHTALAIRHVAFEDLGTVATALQQHGLTVTYVEAGYDDLAGIDPLEPEVLISLGGPIGAYETYDYPFLVDELRLLEQRLNADLPTLGICLGAQLIARVLGARVYPGHCQELGWAPLLLSPAGQRSPLGYLEAEHIAVLHWHSDAFDMPEGAVHLAATPPCANQAFTWGKRTLALQCHLEVTARSLERWWIGHTDLIRRTPGVSLAELRRDTQHYAPQLVPRALQCWKDWFREVLMTLDTGATVSNSEDTQTQDIDHPI